MEWITKVLEALGTVEGMTATLAIVFEFVFRLLPTKKPLSILHIVASVVKGLATVLDKVAKILDKVLPQNAEQKE